MVLENFSRVQLVHHCSMISFSSGLHFHCCWFLVKICTVCMPNFSAESRALCRPPAMERWEPNIVRYLRGVNSARLASGVAATIIPPFTNGALVGLIVQKFGGTSVANAERIHRAAKRVIASKEKGNQVVVVVSAMGETTDQLLELARQVCENPPKRELDQLLATGEQVTIALMAMAISSQGHPSISYTGGQIGLVTDEAFSKARIQSINKQRIFDQLEQG